MKRAIVIVFAIMVAVSTYAQRGQDFASKFMEQCEGDTALQCVTVSPSMMEQLTKQADASHKEYIAEAIEKIKSVRIVTASVNGDDYFQRAEELLVRNQQRFHHDKDYRTEHSYGAFYSRKLKSGSKVELIMLHVDKKVERMVIVNLTGDIDDEFINNLLKTFGDRAEKA